MQSNITQTVLLILHILRQTSDTDKIADAAITAAGAAGGIVANTIGSCSVALGTKTTGNYVGHCGYC